jgi:DNA-binding MarR family transcriptional regulator
MDEIIREQVRAFNRFFAVKIRVFNRYAFETPYSLVEGRIIGEIGRQSGCTANEIAETLDMDKSYLSRVIGKLEDAGLITKSVSDSDTRKKHLYLTEKGRKLFTELEQLSNAQVADMLSGLNSEQMERLSESMHTIQSILGNEHG